MTCPQEKQILERLAALDKGSSLSQKDREHADRCPTCGALRESFSGMERSLHNVGQEFIKDIPWIQIQVPACAQTQPSLISWFKRKSWALLSVFAVVLTVSALIWSGQSTNEPLGGGFQAGVQIMSGNLTLPGSASGKAGDIFDIGPILNEEISCSVPTKLHRLKDLELDLQPCRFAFIDGGIKLESGSLEVWVYKKNTRFKVVTPTAILGVRGTRFSVEVSANGDTLVVVGEGQVWVENKGGKRATLVAGNGLRVSRSGNFLPFPDFRPHLQEIKTAGNIKKIVPQPASTSENVSVDIPQEAEPSTPEVKIEPPIENPLPSERGEFPEPTQAAEPDPDELESGSDPAVGTESHDLESVPMKELLGM